MVSAADAAAPTALTLDGSHGSTSVSCCTAGEAVDGDDPGEGVVDTAGAGALPKIVFCGAVNCPDPAGGWFTCPAGAHHEGRGLHPAGAGNPFALAAFAEPEPHLPSG